jgi:hypothetical protein
VKPALDATSQLAPELQRTFTRLQPVVRHSSTTLPALQRVLTAAGPLMRQLAPAGRQLVPVLQLLEAYRHEAVGSLANAASATSEIIGGHHGLRILLTLNSQAPFGQETPQGSWRVNPYPAPGQLFNLAQGKAAFTCRDASRPTTIPVGGAPPCLAQKPWTFQGQTRSYPHVQPNRP